MLPEEFAQLADQLKLSQESFQGMDDAVYRTCTGRHYYHLYHIVKNWLESVYPNEFSSCGGTSHKKLQYCCNMLEQKLKRREFYKLQLKLQYLHNMRCNADYYLDEPVNAHTLAQFMREKKNALDVINLLKQG